VKFQEFAKILKKIESTSSRIEMTDIVVRLLKSLKRSEVQEALYLMQGRVVPRFVDLEFNVARRLMMRALAKAYKLELVTIEKKFSKRGDLGLIGEDLNKKRNSTLDVSDVYQQVYDIAALEGKDSQSGKVGKIVELIKSCDKLSCRYVIRMILGSLRLGVSDKSILDALSVIAVGDKSKRTVLDKVYGARSDIGYVAVKVIREGISSIEDIGFQLGVPVASMNCERENKIEKIIDRMGEAIFQPKYDGLRCQVHYKKGGFGDGYRENRKPNLLPENKKDRVRIFSRNLKDLTDMFPDVIKDVAELKAESIIFDSEAVGYDPKKRKFLPFQETIQRRRKYEVKRVSKDVPIRLFAFDLLYLNGKDFSNEPFEKRLDTLKDVLVKGDKKIILLTPSTKVKNTANGKKVFGRYVKQGHEGIIAKDPQSKYFPGKRGFDWIKYKKSTQGFLVDTVDAVVLGYYSGRGARAKFGIGAILVGVLNKKRDKYESIAKVGTGIKDEDWKIIKRRLDDIAVSKMPKNVDVDKDLAPTVWVDPEVIVEVEADEITKSPNHRAGFEKGKGYSLRFPRLKIFDRQDKELNDITSVREIKKMSDIKIG
jgi:DNA ligase-1